MSQKENKKKEVDVVTCPNKDQVIIHEPKTKVDLTKFLDNQHFRLVTKFCLVQIEYLGREGILVCNLHWYLKYLLGTFIEIWLVGLIY